jgi:uncharacterized protein (TIGR04551 family)
MFEKAGSTLSRLAAGLPITLALLGATPAFAQMGGMSPGMGGMGPGMGRPGMGGGQQRMDKDDGPAEAAPDAEEKATASKDSDDGYLEQARRRTKMVEIDGYFRLRTDYLYKMNLDQGYNAGGPGPAALPPFPTSSECMTSPGQGTYVSCSNKGMGSGNMRLRLEPTINISDQVRVRTQLDVFDNLILGSTPDSLINPSFPNQDSKVMQTTSAAQTDVLSNTQNSYAGSIVAKRAWGEIDTELGSIRFGRMPWHFGRGMYYHRGDCADCDGGTTVDRVMALTTVYGHQLALGIDFGSQGYHIGYTDLGRKNSGGFPLDLTQKDDVTQWTAAITKLDEPAKWRERISAGELVLNYGAQVVYRSQDYATFNVTPDATSAYYSGGQNAQIPLSSNDLGNANTLRVGVNALLFIPSIWFKLGWKALTLEFEGTMLAGKMANAGPLRLDTTQDKGLKILQAGWVLASELRLYSNSLFIGFETGGATGDQAEMAFDPSKGGSNGLYYPYLNYRWKSVPQPAGDRNLNNFHFSPEYRVDEILYRRILGTVSNAIYLKPSVTYWLGMDSKRDREVGVSGALIYSLAPVPVSTPGNSINYGVEMNVGVQYRNLRENIFGGLTWGVFWPMAALSRPIVDPSAPLWSRPEDANASQVIRMFLGIRF